MVELIHKSGMGDVETPVSSTARGCTGGACTVEFCKHKNKLQLLHLDPIIVHSMSHALVVYT